MKAFFLFVVLLTALWRAVATTVTVGVNVGCTVNPNYQAPTLSIFTSNNCIGKNGGNVGDTFYFEGVADGFATCQGPAIWNSFQNILDGNATLPRAVQRNIWVKASSVLISQPPCAALASFQLYVDQACTSPYNLVASGPTHAFISGNENSGCFNRTDAPDDALDWLPEIGSFAISVANHNKPLPPISVLTIAIAALVALTTR